MVLLPTSDITFGGRRQRDPRARGRKWCRQDHSDEDPVRHGSAPEGKIFINGKEEKITNPLDAIDKGVGMVHQHFMLVPSLSVAENVTLGVEPMKKGLFDFEGAVKATQEIADKLQLQGGRPQQRCGT